MMAADNRTAPAKAVDRPSGGVKRIEVPHGIDDVRCVHLLVLLNVPVDDLGCECLIQFSQVALLYRRHELCRNLSTFVVDARYVSR